MEIIDGNKIAQKIKDKLKEELKIINKKICLAVVKVGEDKISEKFLSQKIKFAEELGVETKEYKFPADISTNLLRKKAAEIVHLKKNTGIIIQLPLPEKINTQYILNSVPPEKDVDVLSSRAIGNFATGRSKILPPIAQALEEVIKEHNINLAGKKAVIVGRGKLVGRPLSIWLFSKPVSLTIVGRETHNLKEITSKADILISGVGKPGLIKGDDIKKGAVVFDFGASEAGGKLKGDVDFKEASKKAKLIAPVPGGLGPIVVACVFKNLISLSK